MTSEFMLPCHVPAPLLRAWEAAYRDYASSNDPNPRNIGDRETQAQLSARVAVAWRRLAGAPGIEWWLVAAFSTAAEAMEHQARDWAVHSRRSA